MNDGMKDPMKEFWVASGHQLCRRDARGRLVATDELLLAFLARPELAPPPEACAAERALHARLGAAPRAPIAPGDVAALADADARENWGFFLRLRQRLLDAPTIEAAYARLIAGPVDLPPIFVDQLAQLVLRNALDGVDDPFALRAGEMFFRAQSGALIDGALALADAEVAGQAGGPLASMFGATPDLDVMTRETAWTYFSRSDAHAMVLPLGAEPRAREGLARAMEAWLAHLAGLNAAIAPVARFDSADLKWFVGLDAQGAALGDALWRGERIDMGRIAALFELRLPPDARLDAARAAAPIPLILGMSAGKTLRMKPQNLLMGLPWAGDAAKIVGGLT